MSAGGHKPSIATKSTLPLQFVCFEIGLKNIIIGIDKHQSMHLEPLPLIPNIPRLKISIMPSSNNSLKAHSQSAKSCIISKARRGIQSFRFDFSP